MAHAIAKLIASLGQAERALPGTTVLAPLMRGGRVRVRIQGLTCELRVAGAMPGWWQCRVRDARTASIVAAAEPWQRGDYLALWPLLRVVLVEPASPASGAYRDWLAVPVNAADARQRFRQPSPLCVRLVEGAERFDRVLARVEGTTLWYDALDSRADAFVAEQMRQAFGEKQASPQLANLAEGQRAAYALASARAGWLPPDTLGTRLQAALELSGARLVSHQAAEYGYSVVWERDGERNVAFVDETLQVLSAGICLSGEDDKFDLASLVGVVAEAPDFARDE